MKNELKFYNILTIVLYILSAFTFWEFIYELCNMVGSIVSGSPDCAITELVRMLPLILTAFTEIYIAVFVFSAFTKNSIVRRSKIWTVNGFVTIVLGAVIALYVIIGVITGEYERLVEGYISPLYPLDIALGGIGLAVFGFFAVRYGKKINEQGSIDFVGRAHGFFGLFHIISYAMSLCGFAACAYGISVLDYSHGSIFYNIMLLLMYFSPVAMAAVYRFVYAESEDGRPVCRKYGIIFLAANIVILALYLLSVQIYNEAPNLNSFAILPIEFTASFNAFLPLYGCHNILAPLAAVIFSFRKRDI